MKKCVQSGEDEMSHLLTPTYSVMTISTLPAPSAVLESEDAIPMRNPLMSFSSSAASFAIPTLNPLLSSSVTGNADSVDSDSEEEESGSEESSSEEETETLLAEVEDEVCFQARK